jgi:hypothetical protein
MSNQNLKYQNSGSENTQKTIISQKGERSRWYDGDRFASLTYPEETVEKKK